MKIVVFEVEPHEAPEFKALESKNEIVLVASVIDFDGRF